MSFYRRTVYSRKASEGCLLFRNFARLLSFTDGECTDLSSLNLPSFPSQADNDFVVMILGIRDCGVGSNGFLCPVGQRKIGAGESMVVVTGRSTWVVCARTFILGSKLSRPKAVDFRIWKILRKAFSSLFL